ncbi:acetylglutamate kinase [Vibrio sp. JCM 19236]|nr:acetylglutamate kinase [Vibrio sp. JCM 19236]
MQAASDLGRPIQVASWRYPEKLDQLFAGQMLAPCFCLNNK